MIYIIILLGLFVICWIFVHGATSEEQPKPEKRGNKK
jgi:hypothetical protein